MQNPVPPKVIPQVLPRSHHPLELSPIDHRRIGEPPLRSIHPHSPAAECSEVPLRPAMNLVALRHRPHPPAKQKTMATAPSPSPPFCNSIHNVYSLFR